MKYLLCLLLLSSSSFLLAQRQFVGAVFGVNASFISNKPLLEKSGRLGIRTGITYSYFSPKNIIFEIGGIYEQKGFVKKNHTTNESITHQLDYLSYPVKFGIALQGTSGYAAFKVGLVPAMLINAANTTGSSVIEITPPIFDLGAGADFVVGFIIKEKIDLYLQVGYTQSFFMSRPNFLPQERLFQSTIDLSIGVRYQLPS